MNRPTRFYIFLGLCVLMAQATCAQESSIRVEKPDSTHEVGCGSPLPFLHRCSSGLNYYERTIGLWGGANAGKSGWIPELGLSLANFSWGEYGGGGAGLFSAVEWRPDEQLTGIRAGIFAHSFFLIVGPSAQVSAVYYSAPDASAWAIRPAIGLGFARVFLHYGYNIFLSPKPAAANKGMFTISGYFPLVPFKTKRQQPFWVNPQPE